MHYEIKRKSLLMIIKLPVRKTRTITFPSPDDKRQRKDHTRHHKRTNNYFICIKLNKRLRETKRQQE